MQQNIADNDLNEVLAYLDKLDGQQAEQKKEDLEVQKEEPKQEIEQTTEQALNQSLKDTTIEDAVVVKKKPNKKQKIKPFTLVQCFYGTDELRMLAATKALKNMLNCTKRPQEWIFIESQKNANDKKFAWLKDCKIKYKFIKCSDKNDCMPLKSALWNIGASLAKNELLAFVDADCWFEDSNWAYSISEALDEYDFCSLSEECIYDENSSTGIQSVGSTWLKVKDGHYLDSVPFGHCGFTFGAKKKAFEKIGKMPTMPVLEDIYTWTKIFGSKCFYNRKECLQWDTKSIQKPAKKFKVGCAKGKCIHVYHGEYKQRKYMQILNVVKLAMEKPFSEICFGKDGLPFWAETRNGQFLKQFLAKIRQCDASITIVQL